MEENVIFAFFKILNKVKFYLYYAFLFHSNPMLDYKVMVDEKETDACKS